MNIKDFHIRAVIAADATFRQNEYLSFAIIFFAKGRVLSCNKPVGEDKSKVILLYAQILEDQQASLVSTMGEIWTPNDFASNRKELVFIVTQDPNQLLYSGLDIHRSPVDLTPSHAPLNLEFPFFNKDHGTASINYQDEDWFCVLES